MVYRMGKGALICLHLPNWLPPWFSVLVIRWWSKADSISSQLQDATVAKRSLFKAPWSSNLVSLDFDGILIKDLFHCYYSSQVPLDSEFNSVEMQISTKIWFTSINANSGFFLFRNTSKWFWLTSFSWKSRSWLWGLPHWSQVQEGHMYLDLIYAKSVPKSSKSFCLLRFNLLNFKSRI